MLYFPFYPVGLTCVFECFLVIFGVFPVFKQKKKRNFDLWRIFNE